MVGKFVIFGKRCRRELHAGAARSLDLPSGDGILSGKQVRVGEARRQDRLVMKKLDTLGITPGGLAHTGVVGCF